MIETSQTPKSDSPPQMVGTSALLAERRCLTRLVSCGLALCEALESAGIPLTEDQAECKAYIEAWWSVDNPPPGYTPETWAAVERMISANAELRDRSGSGTPPHNKPFKLP
jgi:hypothetical protein